MNVLEVFAADKEAAARLYGIYASRFAGYGLFWRSLAAGESSHAALLRKYTRGAAIPAGTPLPLSAFLDKELNISGEPRLSLLHTLTAAFEIEQQMTGVALPTSAEEPGSALAEIRRADEAHLEMVRAMMVKFS